MILKKLFRALKWYKYQIIPLRPPRHHRHPHHDLLHPRLLCLHVVRRFDALAGELLLKCGWKLKGGWTTSPQTAVLVFSSTSLLSLFGLAFTADSPTWLVAFAFISIIFYPNIIVADLLYCKLKFIHFDGRRLSYLLYISPVDLSHTIHLMIKMTILEWMRRPMKKLSNSATIDFWLLSPTI